MNHPSKVIVCKCEQCKWVKNKRKNRNAKKVIRRLLNKKRRKQTGTVITHLWS